MVEKDGVSSGVLFFGGEICEIVKLQKNLKVELSGEFYNRGEGGRFKRFFKEEGNYYHYR